MNKTAKICSSVLAPIGAAVIVYFGAVSSNEPSSDPHGAPDRWVVTTSNTLENVFVLDLKDFSVTNSAKVGPCLDDYKCDKMAFKQLPGTNSFVKGSLKSEIGHYSQVIPTIDFEPVSTNKVKPFAIGVFEVTQKQYELVTGEPHGNKFVQPDRAKDYVSWNDAHLFIDTLNKKLSGYRVRLASDTEWEYACRAGYPAIQYAFGYPDVTMTNIRVAKNLDKYASYLNNADSAEEVMEDVKRFPPVGYFPANDFGLYDMHGGVWEWCEDAWTVNGTKGMKVARGGGYWFNADDCRAANCHGYVPTHRNHGFGFRIVIEKK